MATLQRKPPVKADEPSTPLNPAALLDQQDDHGFEDALLRAAQKYNREHPPKKS